MSLIRDDIKKALLSDYVIEVLICLIISAFLLYHLFSDPESAMMQAVINNDLAATKQLIHGSADVNQFGPCRETKCLFTTPLIEAAKFGRTRIVGELLKAGADINARDDLGTTPLVAALSIGHIEAARILLRHGADPNIATCVGHGSCTNASRCARRLRDAGLIDEIESLGGRENTPWFFSPECFWIQMKPGLWFSSTRIVPIVVLVMVIGGTVRRRFASEKSLTHKPSMDYEEALTAMLWLLETVGESHWSRWIRQDLDLWRGSRKVEHHLSAYGGMGSFNDVSICAANGHEVARESEPWAQETFEALKTLCYRLAHMPARRIGCRTVRLLLRSGKPLLQGWQCLECGCRELTPEELESYVAKRVIPAAVVAACTNGNLEGWISAALAGLVPGAGTERERVIGLLTRSKIVVRPREGMLRPCPACKGNYTVVSYWREGMTMRGRRFVSAAMVLQP